MRGRGYKFRLFGTQRISAKTNTRTDCAFIADDKIFTISNTNLYSVYVNGSYAVLDSPLTGSVGHANSCNYLDGKVYVSDWDVNNKIHVFNVDTTNNTLTYSKDITLPSSNYGDTEYFVTNAEKEIMFCGWKTGDSATTPNSIVYGLYIYNGTEYILSWVKEAIRPTIMQGFCFLGESLVLVNCANSTYHTIGFNKIDMNTGLTTEYVASGTITNHEAEAIFPVDDYTLMSVDATGNIYLVFIP